MISEFELGGTIPASLLDQLPLTSRELALTVDRHLAAVWRGEESQEDEFFRWLTSLWTTSSPPEPVSPPSAVSVLGAGGGGIRWYQRDAMFIGYVDGQSGCYRVPANATPPLPSRNLTASAAVR
jgi:hypothetical protein